MKQQQHLFTNKMLRALLVPIIMEQLLNALMGTVDTMMVSNVGSAAISAVSLVDSINVLIIQAFSALAAGGTIICKILPTMRHIRSKHSAHRQMVQQKQELPQLPIMKENPQSSPSKCTIMSMTK